MKRPTYAVLMSVYKNDNPEHLAIALDSIYAKQSKKPDEIIIVIDGPIGDELWNILNSFKKNKEKIVKLYPQKTNHGLGEALRIGSEKCKSDYIFRMDSDDISDPNRFKKQAEYIEKHPDVDVLGGNISEFINSPENEVMRQRICPEKHEDIVEMGKSRNPMNHVSVCIKKESLMKAGGYKTLLFLEDYYLWLRMIAAGFKLANINETLVYVRIGNGFEKRRSTKKQISGWKTLQNFMVQNKIISKTTATLNMAKIRCFTYMPAWTKKIIYSTSLRSKEINNNTESKKLSKLDYVKLTTAIAILFTYVFKGLFTHIGAEYLGYILTAILLVLSLFSLKKQSVNFSKILIAYLGVGLVWFFISIPLTHGSIITAAVGTASNYVNLATWIILFKSIDKQNLSTWIQLFYKTVIIFGLISAVLGIIQYYIDPSIFGLATNEIYSSEDLLATGKFTRRTTALLGSAQNYGVLIGISFGLLLLSNKKRKIYKWIGVAILLCGIIVSGSRSASVCGIIAILSYAAIWIQKKRITKRAIITTCIVLAISIITAVATILCLNNKTFERLIDFDITPAFSTYSKALSKSSPNELLIGKGAGYMDWTTNQIIKEETYTVAFGEKYTSAESFILLTFLQYGLIGISAVLTIIFFSIKNAIKNKNKNDIFALICIFINMLLTPSFTGMAISFIFWPIILKNLTKGENEKK